MKDDMNEMKNYQKIQLEQGGTAEETEQAKTGRGKKGASRAAAPKRQSKRGEKPADQTLSGEAIPAQPVKRTRKTAEKKAKGQGEPLQAEEKPSARRRGKTGDAQAAPKATRTRQNSGEKGENGSKKTGGAAASGRRSAPAGKSAVKSTVQEATRGVRNVTRRTVKIEKKKVSDVPVRVIPLGGLSEIGKNCTLYECQNDSFMVDCGLAFPDETMLGIDATIPDFQYVEKNASQLRGIVITHGHEDHIGALPYFLKNVNVPVYGTRLTLGLIENKLREHGLVGKVQLIAVKPGDRVKLGCMTVEFINVNHSIPDACALAVHTPAGVIVQTGDFKIDYTPIEGATTNLARFGELGSQGVLALLADSTNAEKPGATMSERKVGESFESLFHMAEGRRLIIATFASNIHRIQQIMDCAARTGRKVAIFGRSMVNVTAMAMELGYLKAPEGLLVDVEQMNRYPASEMVLITTGSQGEPMAALSRMASGEHRQVTVTQGDFIIISATPIPGNEKTVNRVVNDLMKLGAEVIYERMYEVHVSGHACQDELRMIQGLVKPKFFLPVHGEYKHLKKHAGLARGMGVPEENIIIGEIGDVIEFRGDTARVVGQVPSGSVMVDGLGVGDVGSVVLKDRGRLAQDGLIVAITAIDNRTGMILSGPDIVSRGFVYVREAEELMKDSRKVVKNALDYCAEHGIREWGQMKNRVKEDLSQFLYQKTKRSPMILPVIMEIGSYNEW